MEELTRQACADGEGGSLRHELKFEEINGPTYLLQLDVSLIISEISNFTYIFNILYVTVGNTRSKLFLH